MRLEVRESAAATILRGHPWVFRDAVLRPPAHLAAGSVVDLADAKGQFLGRGLWDTETPIAVRIHERDPNVPLDIASFERRLTRAFELRDGFFPGDETTAYRLVNGEGDHIPGLVLDRYGEVAVLRLDGNTLDSWMEALRDPLRFLLQKRGVSSLGIRLTNERSDAARNVGFAPVRGAQRTGAAPSAGRAPSSHDPQPLPFAKMEQLWGPPIPPRIFVSERGLRLEVDLFFGHKTGAFLDHRENLQRIRHLGQQRARVLNLYSYTGGFSLAAALGGSKQVVSVDTAGPAHASAQRSFRENGLDPTHHSFVTSDVITFLESSEKKGDRFDLIISDPPSFAPNEKVKPRAMLSYRKLHRACAKVLAKGGVFCAASCSSHITENDFIATLDDASLDRADLRITGFFGQPEDHPFRPAWPEGRYLKFAILQ